MGYDSIVMGSSLIIWKCTPIKVKLNQNLDSDSADLPITWREKAYIKTGFADPRTMKIKNTTLFYPKTNNLHPSYRVNGSWYCKGSGSRISLCEAPRQFSADISAMRETLDQLYLESTIKGGFNDEVSREEFRKLATQHTYSVDTIADISNRIAMKDLSGLHKAIGFDSLKSRLMSGLLKQLWLNPFAYKLLAAIGAVATIFIIYFVRSCFNIAQVRSIIIEEEKLNVTTNRFSRYNYLYAIISHNQMAVNINERAIRLLKDQNRILLRQLETATTRLNEALDE